MSPSANISSLIRRGGGCCRSVGCSAATWIIFPQLLRPPFSTQTLISQLPTHQSPRTFSSQAQAQATVKEVPVLLVSPRRNPTSCSLFRLTKSSSSTGGGEEKDGIFFSLEREFNLPEAMSADKTYCIGSSAGIILKIKHAPPASEMFAFDPLAGVNFPVPSPATLSYPHIPLRRSKAVLSPSRHMLFLTRSFVEDFAHLDGGGGGQPRWRPLPKCVDYAFDLNFHRTKFCVLDSLGMLGVYDFNNYLPPSSSSEEEEEGPPFYLFGNQRLKFEDNHFFPKYLVGSPDGKDLFLVYRETGTYFKVFKLSKRGNWIRVWRIGGAAIFLGVNQTVSLSASDFPDILKPNSIYFTDSDRAILPEIAGVFSLEDRKTHIFKLKNGHDVLDWPDWTSPVWFTPATSS